MTYAIFNKDGKQVTKAHSTKEAAMMEAFEQGVAFWTRSNSLYRRKSFILENGYCMDEVKYGR